MGEISLLSSTKSLNLSKDRGAAIPDRHNDRTHDVKCRLMCSDTAASRIRSAVRWGDGARVRWSNPMAQRPAVTDCNTPRRISDHHTGPCSVVLEPRTVGPDLGPSDRTVAPSHRRPSDRVAHSQVLDVRRCCFCWCRSIASVRSRVSRSEYDRPVASHILGYIEIAVKPGSVLTSFR